MKKLDTIGLTSDQQYRDFSMIYDDGNLLPVDLLRSLKSDIFYYLSVNQPFKALKRRFALARIEQDKRTCELLLPILNSDLGILYQIIGDIKTLLSLMEYKNRPVSEIKEQVDNLRSRFAFIYTLKDYLKDETSILGEIGSILRLPVNRIQARLERLIRQLEMYLAANTNKVLQS